MCARFSFAALTLTLERKEEDTAQLQANYETMREQMKLLRAAALAKLGLPAEQPEPAATVEAPAAEAPADVSDAMPEAYVAKNAAFAATLADVLTPRNDDALAATADAPPLPQPMPKPLVDALREPLRALDEAATRARALPPLRALDEAASKARATFEREREGLARGLSGALARLRPEREPEVEDTQ